MITERSKSVIPFRKRDAKRVGEGCFYLDSIVWLNGDRIEMGDRVGFNYGCYVNGYGGLVVGDRSIFGPYTMIHTANHEMEPRSPDPRAGLARRAAGPDRAQLLDRHGREHPAGGADRRGLRDRRGQRVVRDVDDYSVAVGNPAKTIRVARRPMRVLFLQRQPCIRALKYALGLRARRGRAGLRLPGPHADRALRLGRRAVRGAGGRSAATRPRRCRARRGVPPDVIHSHNLPDC